MPFYEYECPNCSYRDEVLQKIGDKPLKKCPSCGKPGLRKLISAPVFRLKGSGWYETDFKSDKENKRNLAGPDKDEAKSDAKTDAKADVKADAKPDAKSDAKPESAKSEAPKAEKAESAKRSAAKVTAPKPAARAKPKAKARKRR
jgi:putative FmdB family regulatory protein